MALAERLTEIALPIEEAQLPDLGQILRIADEEGFLIQAATPERTNGRAHKRTEDKFVPDITALYLKSAAQGELLTHEEEIALGRRIQKGIRASARLSRGTYSKSEFTQLSATIIDGVEAKHHIIEANLRLVVNVAKKHNPPGGDINDLIQDGNVGLVRASMMYKPQMGWRFSTYATWWIRQSIRRPLLENNNSFGRFSTNTATRINSVRYARGELFRKLGRTPSEKELAGELDLPVNKIREALQFEEMRYPLSLYMPVNEEEDLALEDFIADNPELSPFEQTNKNISKGKLLEALESINYRHALIVRLHWGLYDGTTYTYQQIGDRLGISKQRVDQIIGEAYAKLRLILNPED